MKQPCVSKTLGVFFNVADPEQKKVYEYAKTLFNFSGHIKKMLSAEMNDGMIQQQIPIQTYSYPVPQQKDDDSNLQFEIRPATPDAMI